MRSKVIAAIDPGAHGACAVWYPTGTMCVNAYEGEDDAAQLMQELRAYARIEGCGIVVYLEKVGGFIKGSAALGSAMFNFGENFGYWKGLARALKMELRLVRPQEWQKGVGLAKGLSGKDRKRALKDAAARLYPNFRCTLDNADALLILDYARRAEAKLGK